MSSGAEYNHLLAVPSRDRLERVLKYMLDEEEFLSPYGIRSLSKYHQKNPYHFSCAEYGQVGSVEYIPAESNTYLFGGNSNWRGPIWFPSKGPFTSIQKELNLLFLMKVRLVDTKGKELVSVKIFDFIFVVIVNRYYRTWLLEFQQDLLLLSSRFLLTNISDVFLQ